MRGCELSEGSDFRLSNIGAIGFTVLTRVHVAFAGS